MLIYFIYYSLKYIKTIFTTILNIIYHKTQETSYVIFKYNGRRRLILCLIQNTLADHQSPTIFILNSYYLDLYNYDNVLKITIGLKIVNGK